MTTTPSEDELKAALTSLRSANPTLGIPKLHALVLAAHPEWSVSEKRTRKILQAAGLVLSPPNADQIHKDGKGGVGAKDESAYPWSKMIDGLDVSKYNAKVAVKYFGREKGKGLVATQRIEEGEVVWKEDPFILAPER